MIIGVFASFLLAASPSISAMPSVPAAPMQADDSPTAFACTVDKIGHGEDCSYEGKAESAGKTDQTRANIRLVLEALRGCDAEAPTVRKACEDGVRRVSTTRACTLQGRARLADAAGFLTPEARACGEALREVFGRLASLDAVASSPCCQCLAEADCAVPDAQCAREVAQLKPSRKLSACLARSCSDECSFLPQAESQPARPPSAAPAQDEGDSEMDKAPSAPPKVPNKI